MMRIFIQNNPLYYESIKYTLDIFAFNKKISMEFVNDPAHADIIIQEGSASDFPIAVNFYRGIKENRYEYRNYFEKDCIINAGSQADLIATCFYMINSLQEYNCQEKDKLGRFTYKSSYQYKFDNVKENLVQKYFDELSSHPKFSAIAGKKEHSVVFISHDIDNINLAWMEDGFAALKKGQIHHLFRLLFNAAIGKPDWFNMDKIMAIHDEYSLKSTFFWLASKGKSANGSYNADYDVRDRKVQEIISLVNNRGFENGIHKSISEESFENESTRLGFKPVANRYHYLKFNLPSAYDELTRAGIKLDASLGFAEHYGFRNSYGQAFKPFDLAKQKAYDLVELPLHVMDRSFYHMGVHGNNLSETVIDFFESNKYDCTLSLLWHNNFFNSIKYEGYVEEYKKIIAFLYENNFKSVTPEEIINGRRPLK